MNWYQSLNSNGTLVWDVDSDLCGQGSNSVICDSSTPPRVSQLYPFFSFLFFSFLFEKKKKLFFLTRVIRFKQINGTIPSEFGLLTGLTDL